MTPEQHVSDRIEEIRNKYPWSPTGDIRFLLNQLDDYRHAALSSDAALEQADLQIGALRAEQARLRAENDQKAGWQPIATAPKSGPALFWIVPKTAEESYVNSSGDPIVAQFEPYLYHGNYGWWSSLSKATHWMSLPEAPRT